MPGMSLTTYPVLMFLWRFLHIMSLVPYWLLIIILWLGTRSHQTFTIHMTVWCRIGPAYPTCIWVCVVLWNIPSAFTYLCSLLCDCVISYAAKTFPPVESPSVCLHVSNFDQDLSYLIPTNWPPGGNWGIYQHVLRKFYSAVIFDVVGVTLPADQNDPPLMI